MSDKTEDGIIVSVGANIASLVTGMREGATVVTGASEEMSTSIKGLTSTIEGMLAPLAAMAALFEAFSYLTESVSMTNEFGEQLRIAAAKTGIAVEQLSALQFAAHMADVDVEALTTGLQRLSRNLEAVAKGGKGPATDALAALGVSATTADGHLRPLHDILLQLAERFSRFEDGAGKTALAMDLFGRSGASLIPLLNEGAAGIAELEKKAKELGVTMNADDVEAARLFDDQMKELHAVMQALQREIGLALMPILIQLAKWFESTIGAVGYFADEVWRLATGFSFIKQMARDRELQAMLDLARRPTEGPKSQAPAPKDTGGGPSALDLLREEWNKRKEIAIANDEDILALEVDFWKSKLALEKEGTKEYIDIHSHLVDLEAQFAKRRTAADKKAVEEWKKTLEEAPKAFEHAFRSMQQTGGSFRDFMRDLWYEIVAMSAKAGFDMLATYAAQELTKRGITKAGALETIAIKTWEGLKWIAIEAAKAAASVWAAVSAIPGGAFIAPALAAATLGGVLALAGAFGGHGGSPGGAATSPPAARGTTVNHYSIHAMDAKSFKDFAGRNPDAFVHAIGVAVKSGALTPKKLGL